MQLAGDETCELESSTLRSLVRVGVGLAIDEAAIALVLAAGGIKITGLGRWAKGRRAYAHAA